MRVMSKWDRFERAACGAVSAMLVALLGFVSAPSALALQGIDVSGWQPSDVSERVAGDFAIVKISQGTSYLNPAADAQLAAAVRSGKQIGVYHYAGGGSCTAEADYFLAHAQKWIRKAVLVLDWEAYQNSAWGNANWSTCFVQRVTARTGGVIPMVYVQQSALWQVAGARRAGAGLWVAQYASNSATGYQSAPWRLGQEGEAMRQYTSHGLLPGYTGYLDLNYFRGSASQWQAYANPGSKPVAQQPQAAQQQPKPSVTTSCVLVRYGDSLAAIALRYGGSWTEWRGYRSGNPSLIYPGERVCRTAVASQAQPAQAQARYVVRSGDNLSTIAAKYGTTWQQLQAWNGIANANLIFPGQSLRVR